MLSNFLSFRSRFACRVRSHLEASGILWKNRDELERGRGVERMYLCMAYTVCTSYHAAKTGAFAVQYLKLSMYNSKTFGGHETIKIDLPCAPCLFRM